MGVQLQYDLVFLGFLVLLFFSFISVVSVAAGIILFNVFVEEDNLVGYAMRCRQKKKR